MKRHCPKCVSAPQHLSLLSICPSCLLITYSIMFLGFLLAPAPWAFPCPLSFLCLFFHFLLISIPLILLLGVRMQGFSIAASRTVFTSNHRQCLTDMTIVGMTQPVVSDYLSSTVTPLARPSRLCSGDPWQWPFSPQQTGSDTAPQSNILIQ